LFVRVTPGVMLGAAVAAGGFTTTGGRLDIDRFGPSGSRNVSEPWGTDAVADPQRLTGLQDLYRTAPGLPPLPTPNTVAYLRAKVPQRRDGGEHDTPGGWSSSGNGSKGGSSTPSGNGEPRGGDGGGGD
jgi:hypothetical protein